MQIVTRLVALSRSMSRTLQLNRQFREIQRNIDTLPVVTRRELSVLVTKEFALAAASPHLYLAVPEQPGSDTAGKGTEIGFSRVKSDNRHVKLRGIALWLTVTFFETKDSASGATQTLHRQLMRTLRVLKESMPAAKATDRWITGEQNDRAVA
jgi:hypothetical protein